MYTQLAAKLLLTAFLRCSRGGGGEGGRYLFHLAGAELEGQGIPVFLRLVSHNLPVLPNPCTTLATAVSTTQPLQNL